MVNVDNRPGGPRDPRGSNNTMWFIIGALVLAVLIIGWFMYGGDDADVEGDAVVTEEPATPPAGDDTDITIEPAAPEPAEPVEPAAPAEPAEPAEPATPDAGAPADGAAPDAGTPPADDATTPAPQ